LPVATKEMLRQEFDLRQNEGIYTQVRFFVWFLEGLGLN
jgi:hypothetical protein